MNLNVAAFEEELMRATGKMKKEKQVKLDSIPHFFNFSESLSVTYVLYASDDAVTVETRDCRDCQRKTSQSSSPNRSLVFQR